MGSAAGSKKGIGGEIVVRMASAAGSKKGIQNEQTSEQRSKDK